MSKKKILICILLLALCFIIPLHIYIIGDVLGAGVQGAFFRYQVTGYGNGFIFLNQDLGYVINGIYAGKMALSVLMWTIADLLLLVGTFLYLIQSNERTCQIVIKKSGLLIVTSGILFLLSCIIQYGFFLQGPAGTSIPVGVPLVIISGWFVYVNTRDLIIISPE